MKKNATVTLIIGFLLLQISLPSYGDSGSNTGIDIGGSNNTASMNSNNGSYNNTNTSNYNTTNNTNTNTSNYNTTNNTNTSNYNTTNNTNLSNDSHNATTTNTTNNVNNSVNTSNTSNNTTNLLGGTSSSSATGGTATATGGNSTINGGNTTSNSNSTNTNNVNGGSSKAVATGGSGGNASQSSNVTVQGSHDFTLNLPNYVNGGIQSVETNGASSSTPSIGIQGYTGSDGYGYNQSGVLVGITVPLGNGRAKEAQKIAIERAKNTSLSEKIHILMDLRNAGYIIQDTPETHELYVLNKALVK